MTKEEYEEKIADILAKGSKATGYTIIITDVDMHLDSKNKILKINPHHDTNK